MIMTKKITAGVLAIMMIFGTGVLQTVNVLPETAITASAADEDILTFEDYGCKVLDDGSKVIDVSDAAKTVNHINGVIAPPTNS